jgi:hypothetical protein
VEFNLGANYFLAKLTLIMSRFWPRLATRTLVQNAASVKMGSQQTFAADPTKVGFGLKLALRCALFEWPLRGTMLPFAHAAFADAEMLRRCGARNSAAQQISPDWPFTSTKPVRFQPVLSLRPDSTN